jgi:hypothetical protein
VSSQLHALVALTVRKEPSVSIGASVGPRTGLATMEKEKFLSLPGFEPGPFNRPAHSPLLYQSTLLSPLRLWTNILYVVL